MPVRAARELAHRATRALFRQGVDAGATQRRVRAGVGVQRDEQVGVRLPRDRDPAVKIDIGVARAGQAHAVAAGLFQFSLELLGGRQGDGAFADVCAAGARIAPSVAGVDHDHRLVGAARRRQRLRGRTRGLDVRRARALRLHIDDVAIVSHPVAGRQKEATLDLAVSGQVQLHTGCAALGPDAVAADQARAFTRRSAPGRDLQQRQDDLPLRSILDHPTLRRTLQIDDHARALSVAAEAHAQQIALRAGRQAATGQHQQSQADDQQGERRHGPLPQAPARQIQKYATVHSDGFTQHH